MLDVILITIIAVLAVALLGLFFTQRSRVSPPESLSSLSAELKQINEHLRSLTGGQGESRGSQKRVEDDIKRALERIERLRAQLEERRQREEDTTRQQVESLKRLEATLLGSKSAGILGENIVSDQMKKLLPDWIVSNFKIGSQIVEFGFRLFDGRVIPIDSKVVAIEKIQRLPEAQSNEEKEELLREINKAMAKKVREVSRYIDPKTTYHKAIVAVPDAIYGVLAIEIFNQASQSHVYILPYSMLSPFLLTILDLERKSQATFSQRRVQIFLSNLRKNLMELKDLLDDSIARGHKMIGNAYERSTALISGIMVGLEALEESEEEIEELEEVI